jgi:DNA adenine methylase
VLFRKEPSKVEVLNDLDYEVANFFRVCQSHFEELVRYLRFSLISRQWFETIHKTDPTTLTDIQRAARFFFLQKNSFGGLVVKQHFHYGVTQRSNFNPARIPEIIEDAHKRLAQVQIECLPYEDIIERYDRPTTLFFLDPPYWGPKLYKFNFAADDFKIMAERVSRLKGRFIISLNDRPEVRETFSAFHIESIDLAYTAQSQAGRRYPEVLISNFEPVVKPEPDVA